MSDQAEPESMDMSVETVSREENGSPKPPPVSSQRILPESAVSPSRSFHDGAELQTLRRGDLVRVSERYVNVPGSRTVTDSYLSQAARTLK
jgi:hypothetical protein